MLDARDSLLAYNDYNYVLVLVCKTDFNLAFAYFRPAWKAGRTRFVRTYVALQDGPIIHNGTFVAT